MYKKWLLFLPLAALLSACQTISQLPPQSEAQMRQQMGLDPAQIMTDLAPKTEQTLALGPKIDRKPTEQLDQIRRNFINESQRSEDGQWKSFNVNLNFVDVDIRELAQAMTQISGVNILVGDEVDGTVTVKINNVPWDKALDNILRIKGLSKSVDPGSNIIRIQKPETVLARDEFERKRLEEVSRQIAAKRIVSTQVTEIFRLYYTKPAIVKKQLEAIFGGNTGVAGGAGARPPGGIIEITTDDRINSIIVKGTQGEMELAAKLISKLDIRTQEVLIEAFIVEASDDWQFELGSRFGYKNTAGNGTSTNPTSAVGGIAGDAASGNIFTRPVAGAPFGLGYLFQTTASQLKVELTALEKLSLVKIVSNPHVFTMDNEEAVVIDGVQIPYPVPGVGTNQITYEFKDAALKLTATPSIVGDGNLFLNMIVNKDSPNYSTNPPSINKREVRSKLLIQDGTIAVIGGIYDQTKENTVEKVPLLGDIPLLGSLFSYTKKADKKTQLLVFIAPKILN
ncbi:type IV pilus secretin PilQ [Polynucleobacter sp. AP-Kolm-20A-A1]|uniref:type IV pilus secretin PilQ n=1 Tax=Polynucleobacter sp. AP-Kolm-20A-A1 TaxID=2081041 RepID=UPI001BFD4F88|nr:type IV pilus secretin PilQ [Polynucleobacter sp. AP-Kolm-20A-A1]QWE21462.1 type IV pilus secretin PilQ [Polynucleobacter sp. AP-Kolm-20A-A1]